MALSEFRKIQASRQSFRRKCKVAAFTAVCAQRKDSSKNGEDSSGFDIDGGPAEEVTSQIWTKVDPKLCYGPSF